MADIKTTWLGVWQHTPDVPDAQEAGTEDHLSLHNIMRCVGELSGSV